MAEEVKPVAEVHEHYDVVTAGAEDLVKKATDIDNDVRIRQKKSKEEKKLVRRMDMLILSLLSGSIFFAYLVSGPASRKCKIVLIVLTEGHQDRGQIGNARIMGMQEDIGLSDQQYSNCLMIFCTISRL